MLQGADLPGAQGDAAADADRPGVLCAADSAGVGYRCGVCSSAAAASGSQNGFLSPCLRARALSYYPSAFRKHGHTFGYEAR